MALTRALSVSDTQKKANMRECYKAIVICKIFYKISSRILIMMAWFQLASLKKQSRKHFSSFRNSQFWTHFFLPINFSSGHRLRKISGNLNASESSSLSARGEVRYCRAEEGGGVAGSGVGGVAGEERMVLVTPEKKVPFAVLSVIPFTKGNRLQHHRWEFLAYFKLIFFWSDSCSNNHDFT